MTEDAQPKPRQGVYAKGVARRQEILDRSIEVFAARGSGRTSLRAIAREIGVTHAALSHYFGSLEELLVAVYEASSDKGGDPVPDDASPMDMMIESARTNRDVPGLVQLYSSLVAAALEDDHPVAHAFASTRFANLRHELAERIRQQQRSGRMRADVDAVAVAALVIAASDGLQTQWLLDERAPQHEALAVLEQLLQPPGTAEQGP